MATAKKKAAGKPAAATKTGPGYPDGDAGEVLAEFDLAARPILRDLAVWDEEAGRADAVNLPWPLAAGEGYVEFTRCIAEQLVQDALDALRGAFGAAPDPDQGSPHFQVVLRVVERAMQAGELALQKRFGGSGRMSIRRDIENFAKKLTAEEAVRSGLRRDEAFKKAGISKPAAYRALNRKRRSR